MTTKESQQEKRASVLQNRVHRQEIAMEKDRLGQWGNGDSVVPGKESGLDRLKHPGLNKVFFSMIVNTLSGYMDYYRTYKYHKF